jgi:ubiquinone/menaquinone biosynthesis C-methylase UbiE
MLILAVTWLVGKMAGYKKQLFDHLDDNVRSIVEVGVGTGPNLKFYGGRPHIEKVIGVDPNERMARFAEQAALDVGLAPSQFKFLHGVQ